MYIGDLWLKLWLNNCCKNTGYYSIFQLSLLLLLNNYQYNSSNTISSVSVVILPRSYNSKAGHWIPVLY